MVFSETVLPFPYRCDKTDTSSSGSTNRINYFLGRWNSAFKILGVSCLEALLNRSWYKR